MSVPNLFIILLNFKVVGKTDDDDDNDNDDDNGDGDNIHYITYSC